MSDDGLTMTEAAAMLGKSRRTVERMLAADSFPGAVRTSKGWRIPRAAVAEHLEDPDPPEWQAIPIHEGPNGFPGFIDDNNDDQANTAGAPDADRVAELTDELMEVRALMGDWRRRAEVAEAVAAERADALEDARAAYRGAHDALVNAQKLAAMTAPPWPPPPLTDVIGVTEVAGMKAPDGRRWVPRIRDRWKGDREPDT